jgi:hypothetical protein
MMATREAVGWAESVMGEALIVAEEGAFYPRGGVCGLPQAIVER